MVLLRSSKACSVKYLLPLAPSQGTALVGKKLISLEGVGKLQNVVLASSNCIREVNVISVSNWVVQ